MSISKKKTENPTVWQMVASMLAAFVGVQSDSNLDRDDNYIEKHGFKPFIVIGIILTLIFVGAIFLIVRIILHFAG